MQTKPTLADRNAESGTGNWAGAGNHSISATIDQAYDGLMSFKAVASAAGDFVTNYVSLPAASNSVFMVGGNYELTLFAFSIAGCSIQIKTGGVQSSVFAIPANVWTAVKFQFTASTASTALQIIATAAATFYFDDIMLTSYTIFNAMSVRGLDWPDDVTPAYGNINDYLDASSETRFSGAYVRKAQLRLAVFQDLASAKALLAWTADNNRMIDYGSEHSISVTPQTTDEFKTVWLNGARCGRQYSFQLFEGSAITAWPGAVVGALGQGYGYDYGFSYGDQL